MRGGHVCWTLLISVLISTCPRSTLFYFNSFSFHHRQMFGRTIKASIAMDNGRTTEFIRRREYPDKSRCYECGVSSLNSTVISWTILCFFHLSGRYRMLGIWATHARKTFWAKDRSLRARNGRLNTVKRFPRHGNCLTFQLIKADSENEPKPMKTKLNVKMNSIHGVPRSVINWR